MINRLIKTFIFDEDIRSGLIFSDITKVRLNTSDLSKPRIQLKADPVSGLFPTDVDLFIKTPLITPNAANKWLQFEQVNVDDLTNPVGTNVQFKVRTTGSDFFWNGSIWAVAGLSDWSTPEDISANLSTFPIATVGNKSIGFIINLVTTDPAITPNVTELKLLGEYDIDFLDDIIYDGVIRTLNTQFRSSTSLVFPVTGASISSLDLNAVLENKAYNITGIRKSINLSTDPLQLTDITDVYTPGALRQDGFTNDPGVVTFTSSVGVGEFVKVVFEYVPEILIRRSQDHFEVPTFPTLVFERIATSDRVNFFMPDTNSYGKDVIRDKPNLTGVFQFSPRQESLLFEFALFTDRQEDQVKLLDDFNSFLANTRSIKSFGLDNEYDLDLVQKANTSRNKASKEAGGADDTTDTNVADGAFELLSVLFFDKLSKDVPLTGSGQFNINVTFN